MNWFLLLIILLMAGGGYYEYQTLHGQVTVDDMQVSDLKSRLQLATDGAQKSAENITQLTASVADAQAKTGDLQKQLDAAKASLATAQAQIQAAQDAAKPSTSASPGATASRAVFTTKLGTITALDGKTYTACQLLKINTDSIVISNADGITQVSLNVLPSDMQKMLGYDNTQGRLTDAQVQLLEQKRQSAAASGN
ncbi:MAG TPA: hypothetical protein VHY09_15105 [Candidatus Methylacidiphilales bacterium]|jgi:hypothetical protein|nr:hypothetical protein [Candidatus Methylacidiphilales bacterium]